MNVCVIDYLKLKKLNVNGESYRNYDLRGINTFKIGGKCKVYLKVNTLEAIIKVMEYITQKNLDYFIIGNGSNLLVSDKGYLGVIIRLSGDLARIEYEDNLLICGGGAMLAKAYATSRDLELSGFEGSAGIPATIGGAIFMNAQAYDFEISNLVDYVIVYDKNKIRYLDKDACQFAYRSSVFQKSKCIILRVAFKLEQSSKKEIEEKYLDTLNKRKSSQPIEYPSAGSVFKRKNGLVISKMLDELGVKGMKLGGAEVSQKHANFIINKGNATASDVYKLIHKIKKIFYTEYNTNLECEIKFLGDFDEVDR